MLTRPENRLSRRMDPLMWLILVNGLGGALVALFVVGAMFVLDVGRLATLIASTDTPVTAVALLTAGFVVTFASAAMGSAIMRIGADGARPDDRQPVPVRIDSRDRRR